MPEFQPTHERIQEIVDGTRILRAGIRNNDPEMKATGWQRLRTVRSASWVKRLHDELVKQQETNTQETKEHQQNR